jgi:hypothetical protein
MLTLWLYLIVYAQAMMRPCYSALLTHAGADKPAIVFVPTRKHVRLTALDLLTSAAADGNQHRCELPVVVTDNLVSRCTVAWLLIP